MESSDSFGYWLEKRRKALDLTRQELANKVGCSISTLRKIESDERRPSKQLAELIANVLEIRMEDRAAFLRIARAGFVMEQIKSSPPFPDINLRQSSEIILKYIPVQPTPLIGRETELTVLRQMLNDSQCKLITLTGLGGSGKTRLALHTGEQVQADFAHGVAFIPLASVDSVEAVILAVANGTHLHFYGPSKPRVQLFNYLCDKQMLLILDNVEQLLIEGSTQANIVELMLEILQHAPGVKLLVTSREALNLQAEWVFEVEGLPYPEIDQMERSEKYAAVALFVQRARRVSPRITFNEADLAAIGHICRLVEGLPLAIELAATWVRLLSPAEITQEIEGSLDLLSASLRDIPERHRSMRVVFDHSWQRLSANEQQVLCQLSVFRGGFSRQAAELVAGASLSVLSTLVNRTLLKRTATDRYELHELVRQYSAAHLEANPQAYAATQKRHYDCFLTLAEAAERELKGRNQLEWLGRLELELDNLRAALVWALESDQTTRGGDESALRLSGVLRWLWRTRGHFHEGLNWLTKSLRQAPEKRTAARAAALSGKGLLLSALGDLSAAHLPADESAAIYRELGDQGGLAEALSLMGLVLIWQGEANLGRARLEEALAIFRHLGDRWSEAQTLYRLGSFLADYTGDPTGRAMLEESAAILEALGAELALAGILTSLGIVDMGFGDYAAARARFQHSLAIARAIQHPLLMADALTNLGCVYRILGEYTNTQSHLEQALQVYQEYGCGIWRTDVLCALAENALSQGDLSTARFHLQAATNLLGTGTNKWLHMLVCYFQGLLAHYEGDARAASILLDATTALAREGQFKPDLARSLVALGRVKRTLGQVSPALELLIEGLDLFRTLGHKLGVANAIEELAATSVILGDNKPAVILFSTAHTLREEMGAPLPLVDRVAHDSVLAVCRAQLGEAVFAQAWAEGKGMPLEQVLDAALEKYKSISLSGSYNPI